MVLSALRTSLTRSGSATLGADWERPGPNAAMRRNDMAAGLVVTLITVAMVELSRSAGMLDYGEPRALWEELAWGAAIALPLTVRRSRPLAVLVICSAVFLGSGIRAPMVGATFMVQVCFFSSLYTAAAWGRDRQRTSGLFGVVALVMFAWLALAIAQGGMVDDLADTEQVGLLPPVTSAVLVMVVMNIVYFLGAWMVGTAAWRTARQREELRLQTERLAAEQELSARRAVLADRVRIARELHDVVAHHVSLIGVQAAAARRTLERDPEIARQALTSAEESSRRAVGEMRSLLGVLRSGDEPDDQGPVGFHDASTEAARDPQPGLQRLSEIVDDLQAQGLTVRLLTVGQPFEVPETVSLSLYRTVQEAVSNVLRHSTAREAQVTLRYLTDGPAVEVEVLDDGSPTGATGGSGLGHVGMRERAALHDGEVEIGRRPLGGFRVRMRFPVPPAGFPVPPAGSPSAAAPRSRTGASSSAAPTSPPVAATAAPTS